jgi:hypothetical protein
MSGAYGLIPDASEQGIFGGLTGELISRDHGNFSPHQGTRFRVDRRAGRDGNMTKSRQARPRKGIFTSPGIVPESHPIRH